MKFTGCNLYHEQVQWLHFERYWKNQGSWIPEIIRIGVNRFGCDITQIQIHKFTAKRRYGTIFNDLE